MGDRDRSGAVTRRTAVTVALVVVALVVAVGVDVLVDYPVPGRMALVALGSSFGLVLGAKWLAAAFLQQPVGTRAGELGNPADDISPDWIDTVWIDRDIREVDGA
jgi:hypothetical protein